MPQDLVRPKRADPSEPASGITLTFSSNDFLCPAAMSIPRITPRIILDDIAEGKRGGRGRRQLQPGPAILDTVSNIEPESNKTSTVSDKSALVVCPLIGCYLLFRDRSERPERTGLPFLTSSTWPKKDLRAAADSAPGIAKVADA